MFCYRLVALTWLYSAGVGEIGVTLRACSTAAVDAMAAEMQIAAEGIARYHDLACEVVRIDRVSIKQP